ncbi:MAG: hypothetical protein R3C10_20110 [Pirellulales bacterium]
METAPREPVRLEPRRSESAAALSTEPVTAIDDDRLATQRIRRLDGRHLTLLTDLPSSEPVNTLVDVFDAAYPLWCEYFQVEADTEWRMFGCVMNDRQRFERAGLLPDTVRQFREGYSQGHWLWLYDQPNDYYRRHLLLHEGTHGFMATRLGGMGPHWYMEGMAELLGTHRWKDGVLRLGYFPADRSDVPMLGRIKLVQEAVADDRLRTLDDVLNIGPSRVVSNEPYAWCWSLCTLLNAHPRYRDTFRTLGREVTSDAFNERVHALFGERMDQLAVEWPAFAASLEHAADVEATALDFTPGEPLAATTEVTVDAARGWQNTGLHVEAGQPLRFEASGRYQIAATDQPWMCEPGGVTIRYYAGRPLGVLLAAVIPDDLADAARQPPREGDLLMPLVVGLGREWTPGRSGTLQLRVNDSAGELADNAGELKVKIGVRASAAD